MAAQDKSHASTPAPSASRPIIEALRDVIHTLRWKEQPDRAVRTIQRVFVAMGTDATKVKPGTVHGVILEIMTAAMTFAC